MRATFLASVATIILTASTALAQSKVNSRPSSPATW